MLFFGDNLDVSGPLVEYFAILSFICRYFPDCYDDDECLYEHNLREDSCPNGQKCTDQACSFSEQNHKRRSVNLNLCRYQEKCNRIGCIFKHNSTRSTFLGPSQSNKRGK